MAERKTDVVTKRYPIRSKVKNLVALKNGTVCSSVKRRKNYKLDENRALNKKLKCTDSDLLRGDPSLNFLISL